MKANIFLGNILIKAIDNLKIVPYNRDIVKINNKDYMVLEKIFNYKNNLIVIRVRSC